MITCTVTDGYDTQRGDPMVRYRNVESLFCPCETNTTSYWIPVILKFKMFLILNQYVLNIIESDENHGPFLGGTLMSLAVIDAEE